jgi:hypothetical protein
MLTYGIKYRFFRFKETYEHPILRGNEKNASDREKRIGSTVAMVMHLDVLDCAWYIHC